MELLGVILRSLAVVFAILLSYVLYRVAVGAYKQYSHRPDTLRWRSRQFGGYNRLPRVREEEELVLNNDDEDEGYHDGESFEIERPSLLQKALPERPLPDKPLPPVPGGD